MDQQSILSSLKPQGPEAWLAYLHPFEEGEPITGPSMLVIFNYAAWLAKKQTSLDWAEVAVRSAELEAPRRSDTEREGVLLRAMRLRSWFISRVGSRPHHVVLDKESILRWVLDGLTLPMPAAQEKVIALGESLARAKNSARPEDMRQVAKDVQELASIKDRLNIAKTLADCGELPSDSPLHKWLEIRERLP
jgi:hypothetical protein